MKPDPKDRMKKDRPEQDGRVEVKKAQDKKEFRSRVESIIERYRPALEEIDAEFQRIAKKNLERYRPAMKELAK